MKKCELCENRARTRYESDQAILCLACDAKVHSANFLVARHSRSLLCQKCQVPTSWRATGSRLSPAVSVCDKCVGCCGGRQASEAESRERSMGGGDKDEEGENQVVPWSSTPPSSLSGPAASRSSNEESSFTVSVCSGAQSEAPVRVSMKRKREDGDTHHHLQEEKGRSSSQANNETADDEVTSVHATVSKQRKKTVHKGEGTNTIVTLSRLQKEALNGAERTAKEAEFNEPRPSVVQLVSTIAQRRVTKT